MVSIDDDITLDPTKIEDLEPELRSIIINELDVINEYVQEERLFDHPNAMRALKFMVKFLFLSSPNVSISLEGFQVKEIFKAKEIVNLFKLHAPLFIMLDSEHVKFPQEGWTIMDVTRTEVYFLLKGSKDEIESMLELLRDVKDAIHSRYKAVATIYYKMTGRKHKKL